MIPLFWRDRDFMRKPAQRDLVAEARLFKLGRSLAVGEVLIRSLTSASPIIAGPEIVPPGRRWRSW
jgi:acyl-coenzyme A thioesterase PaaI-like protein